VYWLTGNPIAALNFLFLGGIAFTAAGIHLAVFHWTRSHAAGLVAGCVFMANRWLLLAFVPRTPHISVLCYFPLIIFLCAAPISSWPRLLLLGLLVVAQGAVDVVYVGPAVLIPMATVAALYLVRPSSRSHGLRLLGVVAVAAAVLFAIHMPYLAVMEQNPDLLQQTLWRRDPTRLVLEIPWGLMALTSPLAVATLAPAAVLAAGLLVFFRGWRGTPIEVSGWRQALVWTAVGIVISLPMNVAWNGNLHALPHLELLQSWRPVARLLAHPERLRVAALMGLALLCGLAFAELLRQFGQPARGREGRRVAFASSAVFCSLIYVQYAWAVGQPVPFGPALPLSPHRVATAPRDSPVLRELRRRGGPTVEVPIHGTRGLVPSIQATVMFRSIYHRQPLLNGYSSFWPASFPDRMKVVARLPDAAALRQLRRETGLAYILVRIGAEFRQDRRFPRRRQIWLDLAARGGRSDLELIASDGELLLFEVRDE
jgi:hypothetical protein